MPAFLAGMLRRGRPNTMKSPASGGEVTELAGEGLGGAMAGRAESAARQAEPVLGGVGVGSALEGRLGSAAVSGGVLAKLGTEAARWAS